MGLIAVGSLHTKWPRRCPVCLHLEEFDVLQEFVGGHDMAYCYSAFALFLEVAGHCGEAQFHLDAPHLGAYSASQHCK